MKTILTISALLFSSVLFGQDSVKLKVTKVRTQEKRAYYWFEDIKTKARYYTVCECLATHRKGELVTVSKRDMEFIKPD